MSEMSDVSGHFLQDVPVADEAAAPVPAPLLAPPAPMEHEEIVESRGVHHRAVNALAALPGGSGVLSVGEDRSARRLDTGGGKRDRLLYAHSGEVTCVVLLGETFAATGDVYGCVAIWDVESGNELCRRDLKAHITAMVRVDERRFAVSLGYPGCNEEVQVWGRVPGKQGRRSVEYLLTIDNAAGSRISQMAVDSRRCLYIATTDMRLVVYDLGGSRPKPMFQHSHAVHNNVVLCVTAGPRWVVSGDMNGDVAVFSVETQRLKMVLKSRSSEGLHLSGVMALVVVNDVLISAGQDRYIVYSTLPNGKILSRQRLPHAPTALAFLPPNRVAIAYANGNISLVLIPTNCLPPMSPPNVGAVPMWPVDVAQQSSRGRGEYWGRRRRKEPGQFRVSNQALRAQARREEKKRADAAAEARKQEEKMKMAEAAAAARKQEERMKRAEEAAAAARKQEEKMKRAEEAAAEARNQEEKMKRAEAAAEARKQEASARTPVQPQPTPTVQAAPTVPRPTQRERGGASSRLQPKPTSEASRAPTVPAKECVPKPQCVIAKRRLRDAPPLTVGRVPVVVTTPSAYKRMCATRRSRWHDKARFR